MRKTVTAKRKKLRQKLHIKEKKPKIVNNSRITNHKKISWHFSFGKRVFIYSVFFIFFIVSGIMLLVDSLTFVGEKVINYYETSSLDYKVYLKENDFYDTDYLEKDMLYVANLIDYVHVQFNYNFSIEEESDIDFSYDIVAKLIISDSLESSNYFEKEYVLSSKKSSMVNDKDYSLKEELDIDYGYYNDLANSFKSTYGVDATSRLVIYLKIYKSNSEDDSFEIDNNTVMMLKIPLSEKAINIELDYNDINTSSNVISTSEVAIRNTILMIVAVVFIALAIVSFIKLFRLLVLLKAKRNYYDRYIEKLLREYDRLIVETSTSPNLDKYNVIKISKFSELLDVRDNLKLPIMYYIVTKHQKCYFYIKANDDIYLTIIKAIDVEKK